MRIKPASGLKVRDHVTRQLLPDEGIDVLDHDGAAVDPYWQRLIRDKDVEIVPDVPAVAAPLSQPFRDDSSEADPAHGS